MNIIRDVRACHIIEHNLTTEGGGYSGSQENVECGILPKDGFRAINDKGETVAWAAIFPGNETHFYVKPEYRRQKIGKALFENCKTVNTDIKVVPWDKRSTEFFNHVGALPKPSQTFRWWR